MFLDLRFVSRVILVVCLVALPACQKTDSAPTSKKIEQNLFVKSAHLPSGWYPQNKEQLESALAKLFTLARKDFGVFVDPTTVKALIVPHAGISYSGLCAASVYQSLVASESPDVELHKNKNIKRVILLAPSHTTMFYGVAIPAFDVYKTVLGDLLIDTKVIKALERHPSLFKTVAHIPDVFATEHAIEIQLPFLQKTIEEFRLVPLIVGRLKDEKTLIDIVEKLRKQVDASTLVVVSSDFTHFGPAYEYDEIKKDKLRSIRCIDSLAVKAIAAQSSQGFQKVLDETGATICGQDAIKILLGLFETDTIKDVVARIACYYTSTQMAASCDAQGKINTKALLKNIPDEKVDNCVSYAGMFFATQKLDKQKCKKSLTGYEKRALLVSARDAVENALKPDELKVPAHVLLPLVSSGLEQKAGCFVTLKTSKGELRGCIGRIVPDDQPLFRLVGDMAKAAAFSDSRFNPVTKNELENLIFDITILTPLHAVDNYNQIEIGKHGIILNKLSGGVVTHSAVFLPQVAIEQGWDLKTTLQQLSLKAGLDANAWKEECMFQVFEGFEIQE